MNISILTFVLDLIAFGILLFLLQKFVFKAVLKMIEDRRQTVRKGLHDIENMKQEFYRDHQQSQRELQAAKRQALQIKEEAIAASERTRHQRLQQVNEEVQQMKKKAKEDIDSHVNKIKEQLKQYSVDLSFALAQRLLGKEISKKRHQEFLRKQLEEINEQASFDH